VNVYTNSHIIKNNDGCYETWNSDLSNEELLEYYIKKGIKPANPDAGTTSKLTEYQVSNHLANRFSNYSNWKKTTNKKYVSDVYGDNPSEIDEDSSYIQSAKNAAGINYKYIGCGPIALFSQFDFLARYAGYGSIPCATSENNSDNYAPIKTKLATEIFKKTPTIAADSPLVQLFGIDPNAGTCTLPNFAIMAVEKLLENYHLSVKKTRTVSDVNGNEKTETYYDNDSLVIVRGDGIPSISSFSKKIDNLKTSIDKGMPVIWWTTGNAGDFSNHYMNIYGYEYWRGTDSNGKYKEHLMFVLRFNWGYNYPIYMDSDILDAINGGFIFFDETHSKTLIRPEDYAYSGQYNFSENSASISPSVGNALSSRYLRAAYVNRYDKQNVNVIDQQLSLSARRDNAGVAYIEYSFVNAVEWIYLQTSLWGKNEGLSSYNGKAVIQYFSEGWNDCYDLLENDISIDVDQKSQIICKFEKPVKLIRIYVETKYPLGTRNKGRLVLGNMIIVHV
jgi:hypothetical protein